MSRNARDDDGVGTGDGAGGPPWRPHGGLTDQRRAADGIGSDEAVIDFSVNVNPYGPTPAMRAAIAGAAIGRYPDDSARAARAALGGLWGFPPEQLVLGNGAAELLWLLARLLVPAGHAALVVGPTFSEFAAAVAATPGARLHEWRARAEDQFRVDAAAVSRAIAAHDPRAVYLCTPNNPTGVHLPADDVAALARRHPASTFVVDQAFLSLCESFADAGRARPDNVVLVRSLTKDHAIPGARVGAAVMPAALAMRLERERPSWSTGAVVQAAALAAAGEPAFVADSRARLLADRQALEVELAALGFACVPSSTIFLLVRAPDADALADRLLRRHHILVRSGASFGLPDHLRLAARPEADRRALLAALTLEKAVTPRSLAGGPAC